MHIATVADILDIQTAITSSTNIADILKTAPKNTNEGIRPVSCLLGMVSQNDTKI